MRQRMGANEEMVKGINEVIAEQSKLGVVGATVQRSGAQQVATFLNEASSLKILIPAMNDLLTQQKGINATNEDAVGVANLEYSDAVHRHLLDGEKVSMYRLGSFRVGLKTKLSENKEDCNADSIVGYRIRFAPDIRFNATGTSDKGFPTGFYSKPLLRGIKAKEMKTAGQKEVKTAGQEE